METNLQNGFGKCPACNSWNTFYEEKAIKNKTSGTLKKVETAEMVKLNDIKTNSYDRYSTNFSELDRVLGGGLVQGSLILLGGEPGIRKININITNM